MRVYREACDRKRKHPALCLALYSSVVKACVRPVPGYGNPRVQYQKSYLDIHDESSIFVLNLDATSFGGTN